MPKIGSLACMKWLQLTLLAAVLLTACKKDVSEKGATVPMQLQLTNVAGTQPLALGTTLTNSFGEIFTLSKYKYYISNIIFIDAANGLHAVPDSYFLIDQSKPASQTITVNTDAATYAAVSFLVGVDSTRNVSGAQSGALDPALDMFWTWNTGYIMAKMEGTAPASSLPNQKIEYHIGGFKGADNALRRIILPFNQAYAVVEGKGLTIQLHADVLQWFRGAHPLPISVQPTCTSPGPLAVQYADNYAQMFTIASIQQ